MPSQFQLVYHSLNQKFYKEEASENLALTFDPIQASDDSESPFKSISASTIEVEKKTIYVCKPSPYFFDSLEKYHQYLLNVQELLDRNFDVRFIYQDNSGDYKVAQINKYNFSFDDENNNIQDIYNNFFYQDPIDIEKARKALGIVHDDSIFLEDFEIHTSRKTIKYSPSAGIFNLRANYENYTQEDSADLSKYIDNLKKIFEEKYSKNGGNYNQYFNIFLITYLEENFDSEFKEPNNGFDKFKTIIDYVFDCLENNDENFFPIDELKSLSGKFLSGKLKSERCENYLNQKISQNNPLQKRPRSQAQDYNKVYTIEFSSFTQSDDVYELNKYFSKFSLKERTKPSLNKLNIISAPPPP